MSTLRSHPVEGPGCHSDFFHYLVASQRGGPVTRPPVASMPNDEDEDATCFAIPHTVVFEHQYPRWWYACDEDSKRRASEVGDIRQRASGGDELHAASVLDFFIKNEPRTTTGRSTGLVAMFVYETTRPSRTGGLDGPDFAAASSPAAGVGTGDDDEVIVVIDYHNARSLEDFLFAPGRDPKKIRGFLQLPVLPREDNYTVMNVSWSPQCCLVRRRSSRHAMSDTRSSLVSRFATFAGPATASIETRVAAPTFARVSAASQRLADTFQRAHHCRVSSMSLFFVVDNAGRLVLLWCGALQFGASDGRAIPTTLLQAPKFRKGGSSFNPPGTETVSSQLAAMDRKERELRSRVSDRPAAPKKPRPDSRNAAMNPACEESCGGRTAVSPKDKQARNHHNGLELITVAGGASAPMLAVAQSAAGVALCDSVSKLWNVEWTSATPNVRREFNALAERQRLAVLAVSDVFYRAEGDFREATGSGPAANDANPLSARAYEVPHDLLAALGREAILCMSQDITGLSPHTLTTDGHITAGPPLLAEVSEYDDEFHVNHDEDALCWMLFPPSDRQDAIGRPPPLHLKNQCLAWIDSYFQAATARLKAEAMEALSIAVISMALRMGPDD